MNKDNIDNIVLSGVNGNDYPDYCDAFIESADYNGVPMTDDQLDEINENSDFIYECVINRL